MFFFGSSLASLWMPFHSECGVRPLRRFDVWWGINPLHRPDCPWGHCESDK